MRRRGSPLWYVGGKGKLADKIIANFPEHQTYVEPFGGGASVLLRKSPVQVEVYNDIHEGVTTLFRVLRDPEEFEVFHEWVRLTPYSRQVYLNAYDTWRKEPHPIRKAYKYFITARMNFGGFQERRAWAFRVAGQSPVLGWLSVVNALPEVAERFLQVQVENYDFRKIFDIYDRTETLFYCDPPYVTYTREEKVVYDNEMTDEDHHHLIDLLLNIKGKAVVSGYVNPIYLRLEDAGWERHDFVTMMTARASVRATEFRGNEERLDSIWVSPRAQKKQGLFQ